MTSLLVVLVFSIGLLAVGAAGVARRWRGFETGLPPGLLSVVQAVGVAVDPGSLAPVCGDAGRRLALLDGT